MPLNIVRSDITKLRADAIVNTANPEPAVGHGVDSAVYEAAGFEELLAERRKIGALKPGQAAATPAFALNADYVIHTVGPLWEGGSAGEEETVAECYRNSLALARDLGCESIAFPLISTGTLGFPKDRALRIAIDEISAFLMSLGESDMDVTIAVYDRESFELSGKLFDGIEEYIEDAETAAFEAGLAEGASGKEDAAVSERRMKPSALSRRQGGFFHKLRRRGGAGDDAEFSRAFPSGRLPGASSLESAFSGQPPRRPPEERPSAPEDRPSEERSPASEERLPGGPASRPAPGGEAPRNAAGSYLPSSVETGPHSTLKELILGRRETFQQYLLRAIDRSGMSDPVVYKRANVDRKLFSKIRSNVDYIPSKKTAVAFAVALKLSEDEALDMLACAGLTLSASSKFDIIIRYCLRSGIYNIHDVNCLLFEYGQPLLGA